MELKYQRESEKRLINAVSIIIEDEGFSKLGINKIARTAECDKVLIYRYFGGLDGLLVEWARKNDFYTAAYDKFYNELESIDKSQIPALTKKILISQLHFLRENKLMQEALVWELTGHSKFKILQTIREENGAKLQRIMNDKFDIHSDKINLYLTIIISAIDFIVIYTRHYPILNDVNFAKPETWILFEELIGGYIDSLFKTINK